MEIAAEYFIREEQPEAESKWPRNSILETANFGEANGEAMLPAETKNLPKVVHVGGEVLGEDHDIIHLARRNRMEAHPKRGPSWVEKGLQLFGVQRASSEI